jgi:predicted DCC family thiol-disulfide oxidoreductase YuxK
MTRTLLGPATLLIDGDCGVCRATGDWLARRLPPARLRIVELGNAVADVSIAPLVAGRPLAGTLHLVRPDGSVVTGAAAVLASGRMVPGWRWLAAAFDHRPGRALLEPAYRAVARHRTRISRLLGLPAACSIVPTTRI